jgi:hypothetical protein
MDFEPGCKLSRLLEESCSLLVEESCSHRSADFSFCVPKYVEVIGQSCFADLNHLASVTFESGSNLREIEDNAFWGCSSLKSLCLPASVSKIAGSTFTNSSIETIAVEQANPHYFVRGDFLVASYGPTFVRYFGVSPDLILGRDFTVMGISCFSYCKHLLTVRFKAGSTLRRIADCAFWNCSSLTSICIPSSVDVIGSSSFRVCSSLSQVTFEPDSKLNEIGLDAFSNCSLLVSICIPARVERLLNGSFAYCCALSAVSFEPGSKLTQIAFESFTECSSIRAFCVPGQLEVMERGLLCSCVSLTKLTFEAPSRLKRLELPPSDFGSLFIPDSVEVIRGDLRKSGARSCDLQFGQGSQLREIELRPVRAQSRSVNVGGGIGVFLRFSESQLRDFRSKCE